MGIITHMARPKEFNRTTAIEKAKHVFWQKGFSATSTEDLRLAMGIGRQSFYDTFIGKWETYLEVVQKYSEDQVTFYLSLFKNSKTPLEALENFLLNIATEPEELRRLGCLGINSVCEIGDESKELNSIREKTAEKITSLLISLIKEAQAKKFISKELSPSQTSNYLMTMAAGLRVQARGGASDKQLKEIVKISIKGLT